MLGHGSSGRRHFRNSKPTAPPVEAGGGALLGLGFNKTPEGSMFISSIYIGLKGVPA